MCTKNQGNSIIRLAFSRFFYTYARVADAAFKGSFDPIARRTTIHIIARDWNGNGILRIHYWYLQYNIILTLQQKVLATILHIELSVCYCLRNGSVSRNLFWS